MQSDSSPQKQVPRRTKTTISLPTWLKADAERLAAERGYNLSEMISRLLERWLEEQAQLKPATREGFSPIWKKKPARAAKAR